MARAIEQSATFDVASVRADFPALHQSVHGHPLAYLDNAASAQCPQAVIDAVSEHRAHNHSNVHRGVHELSERSTEAYEGARDALQRYLNASQREEIVFTRGTTESINLVAASFGPTVLEPGDEILISAMEHHSNIVPWQLLAEKTQTKIVVAPITQTGELDLDSFNSLLGERTKIVAITHVSNALGSINPIADICAAAHCHGAYVVVDGAQAAPHLRIDVQALGCDFYALSGHKMFGPTGIGALYARRELLEAMPPWQGGGEMILTVSFEKSTYNAVPYKFEAGTPNITGAIGLGAAIAYIEALNWEEVQRYEAELLDYATQRVLEIDGMRIVGTAEKKASVLSFVMGDIHAHDLGTIVDQMGVAIRTGHHCAMPVMDFFAVPATARASLAFYNTREDIDQLMLGLRKAEELFG
jgi:cysteine desulfurase/selenocysteine lyase